MQAHDNFKQIDLVATMLAKRAGEMIVSGLSIGTKRDWKSDHTPVTKVDRAINDLVIKTIHEEFPGDSILAEEGSDLSGSREYVWVCDPIDGTFPFMHGIPISTFTLALVRDGQPIYGLIYDPFMHRMFTAIRGEGTRLNGHPIHASQSTAIKDASIGVIFWKGNMDIFSALLPKLVDAGGKIFNTCSVAYLDALVAAGEFAAVIFPGFSAHDSAAPKIIVEEAGGVFTSLTGESDRYDTSVHGHLACANQAIYDQIRSLMR